MLVRASSGARLVLPAGTAAAQQESTATHPHAGGLAGTQEDGDLHRDTRVDALPPDGMQEVSGSSPLSSTGQKRNSNRSNRSNRPYSGKVPQRRPAGPPHVCSDRASRPGWGCWQDTGFEAPNRRWPACHLRRPPPHRSRDSCHLVTTWPPWRTIPASDCCRICKWPRSHWSSLRPGPLPGSASAGQGRTFADGRRGARARRVVPMMSVRRWACWCAAPLRRRLRRGAAVRACRRVAAPREEPGAVRRTETWPGASSYVAHPRFGRCPEHGRTQGSTRKGTGKQPARTPRPRRGQARGNFRRG